LDQLLDGVTKKMLTRLINTAMQNIPIMVIQQNIIIKRLPLMEPMQLMTALNEAAKPNLTISLFVE
jgi:hypothetical protein